MHIYAVRNVVKNIIAVLLSLFVSVLMFSSAVFASEKAQSPLLYKNSDTLIQSIELMGFIKTGVLMSTGATDTFGRPNAVAPTAAGNPILNNHPDHARSTFQSQQSRFGISIKGQDKVSGLLEFDFVDFSKSSPTVASLIRLRRAYVDFENGEWQFRIGQDWDLFSPLAPHSYNFVGHYFGTGDVGFMRQQAQVFNKHGNWEHAIALGFPANNNQMVMSNTEESLVPTLALRETYKLENGGRLGGSAIVGYVKNQDTDKTISPFGLNAFFKHVTKSLEISSEVYYGHNLENLSMLALGYSPTLDEVKELGGFVTFRYHTDVHGIFGGLGHSQILNQENIVPSYSYVSGTPVLNLATGPSTGYGLLENSTIRLGYDYSWSKELRLFTEAAYLKSKHKLDAADSAVSPNRDVVYMEVGAHLEF